MIKILLKNFEKIPEIKEKIIETIPVLSSDIYEFSPLILNNNYILLSYIENNKEIEHIKKIYTQKNEKSFIISIVKNNEIIPEILDYIDDYILLDNSMFFKILKKKLSTIIQLDKRYEIDEELANNIQKIISNEIAPYSSKLDISSEYIESGLVGGDIYDFISMSNNHYGIFIADASGHGPSSALIAAMVKITFRSFGIDVSNPAWVIESINKIVYPTISLSGKFVSAFYAIFGNDKIEYSNAGHINPIFYRTVEDKFLELPQTNTLIIGISRNFRYENKSIDIIKGDIILFYTDGLIEAKNSQNQLFGKERIKNIIKENSKKSVEEIKKIIYDELIKFTENNLQDDITFIVVKVK